MAYSPEQARDQKRFEEPPWDYCRRLAQEMKAFPRKHRLAEFRAEVVVKQTQVLSAVLEDAWIKSFRHADQPKRVDASTAEEIAQWLHAQPRVQASMATLVEYPPSKWLLEQELIARGQWDPDYPFEDVYSLAESLNLKGICFSGGGIRSATFNLGVLQGLAALDKLGSFDYLSTVSGGGHIHQFLAAWISREGIESVVTKLQPIPSPHSQRHSWSPPLRWLWSYSSYLRPSFGFFSADTWAAGFTWIRNISFNLIALTSALLPILLLTHYSLNSGGPLARELIVNGSQSAIFVFACFLISSLQIWYEFGRPPASKGMGRGAVTSYIFLPILFSALILCPYLYRSAFWSGYLLKNNDAGSVQRRVINIFSGEDSNDPRPASTQIYISQLHHLSDPPAITSFDNIRAWYGAYSFRWWSPFGRFQDDSPTSWVFTATLGGIALLVLASCRRIQRSQIAQGFIALLASVGATVTGYLLIQFSRETIFVASFLMPLEHVTRMAILLLPPLSLCIIFISIEIAERLIGDLLVESHREWMTRLGIYGLIFSLAWFAIVFISYFNIILVVGLITLVEKIIQLEGKDWLKPSLWISWIAAILAGIAIGKSPFIGGPQQDRKLGLRIARNILVLVSQLFFLGCLGLWVEWLLTSLSSQLGQPKIPHAEFFMLLILFVSIALIFIWRSDLNEFSLHAFHRDRIARCYAGASNPDRRPNRFTGFAANDKDLRLVDLLPAPFSKAPLDLLPYDGAKKPKLPTYQGPFPIFCTTLNLSFGEDLAYQERKSTSFAFTPLYCGYDVGWTESDNRRVQFNGYTPTLNYAYHDGGPRMATAVAASGAAISPYWGSYSDPAMTFLFAIFNIRLGFWIRNPRRKIFLLPRLNGNPSSPAFGLFYLLAELFGMVNDEAAFVYLTDGGHFENMGLYELVRRHCMSIVICDAELDIDNSFQGLATAIRKCRVDFGAEITLDVSAMRPTGDPGVSEKHSVRGTIRYPSGATGRVLYIKSTITNELPIDLLNYHQEHPAFPNDIVTGRGFSEAQFESYRRLGEASTLTYPAEEWLTTNLP